MERGYSPRDRYTRDFHTLGMEDALPKETDLGAANDEETISEGSFKHRRRLGEDIPLASDSSFQVPSTLPLIKRPFDLYVHNLEGDNRTLTARVEDYKNITRKLVQRNTSGEPSSESPKYWISPNKFYRQLQIGRGNRPTKAKAPLDSLCPHCKVVLEDYNPKAVEGRSVDFSEPAGLGWSDEKKALIWETYDSLEDRASQGCALCLLFFGMLSEDRVIAMRKDKSRGQEIYQNRSIIRYWCVVQGPSMFENGIAIDDMEWGLKLSYDIGGPPGRTHIILTARVMRVPFLLRRSMKGLSFLESEDATFAPSSVNLAKTWFNKCIKRHPNCWKDPTAAEFLPTRLIDIGAGNKIKPRLQLRAEIQAGSSYFTLSHCWGGGVPLRLLNSNFAAFRKQIRLRSLPKTFQDCMHVLRRLGGRYIWIDSLCIIQDNLQDWQDESSQMGEIYYHGICNIAATAAANGSDGLFFSRNPITIRPIQANIPSTSSSRRSKFIIIDDELWMRSVERSPLCQRGWVYQERLLSPRTLHFGASQIYWECRTHSCCESYPLGLDDVMRRGRMKEIGWLKPLVPALYDDALLIWSRIVTSYSGCNLTYETDKLVAISGLAMRLSTRMGARYCAGLWERSLPIQLLWKSDRYRGRHSRYSEYVAPSWSWASVNGVIDPVDLNPRRFGDPKSFKVLIDIAGVSLELASRNPFGRLKAGSMHLQGRLARLTLQQRRSNLHAADSAHELDSIGFGDFIRSESALAGSAGFNSTENVSHAESTFDVGGFVQYGNGDGLPISIDSDIATGRTLPEDFLLLPIVDTRVPGSVRYSPGQEGLVLKATGSRPGEFTRWGYFSTFNEKGGRQLDKLYTSFDSTAKDSGLEYCDDGEGGLRYSITII